MKALISLLLSCSVMLTAHASQSAEEQEGVPQVAYVTLAPALVGNFGEGARLKFFKADLSLRVTGKDNEDKVKHHEPLIRNQLVMLFSQQTEAAMAAPEARETLRVEALKQVQAVLTGEEGQPLVEDLLFNNLIIQ
ncbi:flagellar basal body-associated protein FliL [Pseudomonas sp. 5P_3.1_Bac2]|uniref:flagellar basal body-associated protein FliL n=1 Tax=Pseudomonas sp. 5P_3.1_Bac2 TaxID=2971617 RepID=UPI0021C6650A|nr:flagellar basal body-associated protein FliL [Pseudomonas sp. 5P_3.1_Bac2]MCU1717980.1 flagellar basal body-associated protein FliL [Pseudomonas sp. 5P_3.1_Bac2]